MKTKELRKKSVEDLQKLLIEKKHALQDIKMKAASAEATDAQGIHSIRRDIARILTIITEHDKNN